MMSATCVIPVIFVIFVIFVEYDSPMLTLISAKGGSSRLDAFPMTTRVVLFCSFSAVFVREAIPLREFFMEDACVRGRLRLHKHPTNVFDLVLFKLCGSAGQNSMTPAA